jgi:hypothetical protein
MDSVAGNAGSEVCAKAFVLHNVEHWSAHNCPKHGARAVALKNALHGYQPQWAAVCVLRVSIDRVNCVFHFLEGGEHAYDGGFRQTKTSEGQGCYRMEDSIIAQFCIIGAECPRVLKLAEEVIAKVLIESVEDGRLLFRLPYCSAAS